VHRPEEQLVRDREDEQPRRSCDPGLAHQSLHQPPGQQEHETCERRVDAADPQARVRIRDGQQVHDRHHEHPQRIRVSLDALAVVPHGPAPFGEIARVTHGDHLVVV